MLVWKRIVMSGLTDWVKNADCGEKPQGARYLPSVNRLSRNCKK
jgi:hypothetical protein